MSKKKADPIKPRYDLQAWTRPLRPVELSQAQQYEASGAGGYYQQHTTPWGYFARQWKAGERVMHITLVRFLPTLTLPGLDGHS